MPLLVSAKDIKKSFGARTLFSGLSFSIETGERIGLIGPNGSGKSTLISLLAKRSESEIELDEGEIVVSQGVCIALLEQTPKLDPSHSIFETLKEGATAAEDPTAVALEMFRRMGLDALGRPLETPIGELSGGWQKRVALGREFARSPDLLILDEPTNHLDIEAILWLEKFLARSQMTVMTVTHDRAFLQNTSTRILELDRRNPGGILSVDGDYAKYLQRKAELIDTQKSQEESMKNKLRRETEWLRQGAKARTTKQKARIARAEALADEVDQLEQRNVQAEVKIQFDGSQRKTKRLLEAKSIRKEFGDLVLFKNVDVFLGPGSRIGLLGRNGSGKTSLIRTLIGEYPPSSGEVFQADGLKFAYFEQKRESLDPQATVISSVCPAGDHVEFQGRFIHVRSYLGKFLFSGPQAEQTVEKLSGGEQSRLLLAKLMLIPADILVLDEPTNDLDMATLDVLEDCLHTFPGAVILVTHDRYFLDRVSDRILAFTEEDGQVLDFADLAQWESWRNEKKPAKSEKKSDRKVRKKTKLSYKESTELENIEPSILEKEGRLAELQRLAQAPEVVSDSGKLSEMYDEISQLQQEIDGLYARWEALEGLKASFEKSESD